jgi:SAM-dependent methyltransferase
VNKDRAGLRASQLGYYQFMGHDSAELRRRYAIYADRFATGGKVLDIGCGRGEFLELLAERGVSSFGVDADNDMAELNRAAGRNVENADAIEYLGDHPAEFDGVFAAHVIEHLNAPQVERLIRHASQALRSRGRLIVATPNPGNLSMQLRDFWVDLQHVRFYAPPTVRWLFHEAGLAEIEDGVNPAYPLGPELPEGLELPLRVPRLPPERPPKNLSVRARIRQRTAEWLEPASALERINDLELHVADLEERLVEMRALFNSMAKLWPPAEFYVTGVKPIE